MSDQRPDYSPPPDYSPSPAPSYYGPESFGMPVEPRQSRYSRTPEPSGSSQSSVPARRRRTITIVASIIVAVTLSCCGGFAALVIWGVSSESTTVTEDPGVEYTGSTLTDEEGEVRIREWYEWYPDAAEPLAGAPSDRSGLVAEALSLAAPDFVLEETAIWEGYYDKASDWYYADAYYVRATHPASDSVAAGVRLWVQSDEMLAEDISFETDDSSDVVTTIDSGSRELLYSAQWGPLGFNLMTDDDVALWTQIGRDWPDSVVVDGQQAAGGPDYFEVEITKSPVFAVDGDYPLVLATYMRIDGRWSLSEWEYVDAQGTQTQTST